MVRVLVFLVLSMLSMPYAVAETKSESELDGNALRQAVAASIKKFEIAEDVSIEEAVDSMQLRANMLNFKMVADLPLSEQVKSMGEDANYMRILAFCDALIAKKMVEYDPIFAGFLPCRIAVIEDSDGKGWIITMNMDMMLNAVDLTEELTPLATQVRDTIYSIVDAGVNGDL